MIEKMHISHYTQNVVNYISDERVIRSGNTVVDKLIGCFKPGELICFAGSGGNGKSTILRSIIFNLSIVETIPTAYFCSRGIGKDRIISQFLYAIADLSFTSWTQSIIDDNEKQAIEQAKQRLNNASLYINFEPNITIEQIESDAERLVRNENVKILFIDNIQGFMNDVNNEYRPLSLRLKELAIRLNIPIIVSSYLNWWIWEREGFEAKMPHLGDLAHVGDLNDIADIVLGVYRPELDHISIDELGNNLKGKIRIEVLKSYRNTLNFDYLEMGESCLRFE